MKFFLIIGCALLLSGCVVRGPSVEIPSVSVESPVRVISPKSSHHDDEDYDRGHKRKGCPPGLAKQGRC